MIGLNRSQSTTAVNIWHCDRTGLQICIAMNMIAMTIILDEYIIYLAQTQTYH